MLGAGRNFCNVVLLAMTGRAVAPGFGCMLGDVAAMFTPEPARLGNADRTVAPSARIADQMFFDLAAGGFVQAGILAKVIAQVPHDLTP